MCEEVEPISPTAAALVKELSVEEIVDAIIQTAAKKRRRSDQSRSSADGEDVITPRKRGRRSSAEKAAPRDASTAGKGSSIDFVPEMVEMGDTTQVDPPSAETILSDRIDNLSQMMETPGLERAFDSPSAPPEEQNGIDPHFSFHADVNAPSRQIAPVASVSIPPLHSSGDIALRSPGLIPIDPILLADIPKHTPHLVDEPVIEVSSKLTLHKHGH